MKTRNNFFRALPVAGFLSLSALAMQACNDSTTANSTADSTNKDPKEVAEDKNDAKFNRDSTERDAQFLVNAAEINMEEIALGELAQKNGTMKSVKDLGKMMVAEHTKALGELKALAAKKNVSLPAATTEDGTDAYKKLSDEKKGKDFDKAYADKMVDGHKAAIDKFEKASTDAGDAEIKNFATSMLPALKMHLDHSNTVQEECKKM